MNCGAVPRTELFNQQYLMTIEMEVTDEKPSIIVIFLIFVFFFFVIFFFCLEGTLRLYKHQTVIGI